MDYCHELGPATSLERLLYLVRGKDSAPLSLHDDRFCSTALDDVHHAATEDTVDPDDYLIIRFNKVDQTGLHTGTAGTRNRQSQGVPGLENKAEQILGLIHQTDELRVEMPHQRGR